LPIHLETQTLRSDLARIVQDIFETMLSMEVSEEAVAGWPATPVVTASVQLAGFWNGVLLLQCHLATACEYASVMQGVERPRAVTDDVKDAIGELINMVAGNLKGTLEGSTRLSLPVVVEGADYRVHVLRGHTVARLGFSTPAGPVYVSVVEIRPKEEKEEQSARKRQ